MSDLPKLLLDIGNTSIKGYLWPANEQDIKASKILHLANISEVSSYIQKSSAVLLCSVNNPEIEQQIASHCVTSNIPFQAVKSEISTFGLQNSYRKPDNMGVDRWMAMLAARDLGSSNFIVVDAGTAITTDFVVNNQHLGGWIAPGFDLLHNSILKNTDRVFGNLSASSTLEFGQDTPQCLQMGIHSQIHGSLICAQALMKKHCHNFDIWLTGGNLSVLSDVLDDKCLSHPNLVLHGLTLFVD